MSDYTYIKLTKQDGTPCIVASVASYLTLALPSLGNAYQDTALHLQIRWSSDNVADPLGTTNVLDTGASDINLNKVILFTGSTWISMPEHGFAQSLAGCRVLVDTKGINPDSFLYYSWYYVADGISVHVTPWVSTKLTATAGIPKHSELQDKDAPDQHPISAITGLQDILKNINTNDYQEVPVRTDAEMSTVTVGEGKVITFVGYSNGLTTGSIVMRYKNSSGEFGTLAPKLDATLDDDNLILDDNNVQSGDVNTNISETSLTLDGVGVDVDESNLVLNNTAFDVDGTNLVISE